MHDLLEGIQVYKDVFWSLWIVGWISKGQYEWTQEKQPLDRFHNNEKLLGLLHQ